MDSTKAIYGITNFTNDVKLQNRLSVNGNTTISGTATVNGDFKTMGSLTFGGARMISYIPASASSPIILFGPTSPISSDPCYAPHFTTSTLNQFSGILQTAQSGPAGNHKSNLGWICSYGLRF